MDAQDIESIEDAEVRLTNPRLASRSHPTTGREKDNHTQLLCCIVILTVKQSCMPLLSLTITASEGSSVQQLYHVWLISTVYLQDAAEEFFPASSSALPDDDSPTRQAVAAALANSFKANAQPAGQQDKSSDPSSSHQAPFSQVQTSKALLKQEQAKT